MAHGAACGRPEDGTGVTARRQGGDGVREGKTEEGERWSEGSLVNKLKFKIQFVNSVFLLVSNEKLLNMKVVQNFEIFNFCFRHFFI